MKKSILILSLFTLSLSIMLPAAAQARGQMAAFMKRAPSFQTPTQSTQNRNLTRINNLGVKEETGAEELEVKFARTPENEDLNPDAYIDSLEIYRERDTFIIVSGDSNIRVPAHEGESILDFKEVLLAEKKKKGWVINFPTK